MQQLTPFLHIVYHFLAHRRVAFLGARSVSTVSAFTFAAFIVIIASTGASSLVPLPPLLLLMGRGMAEWCDLATVTTPDASPNCRKFMVLAEYGAILYNICIWHWSISNRE